MVATVQQEIKKAVVTWAIQEFEKGWRFAEEHWYCNQCGFVSNREVKSEDDETGFCRCGQEITKTAF